jgi:thiamine kinase-like enzyme
MNKIIPTPADRINALPIWSGRVDPVPLPGGLSNESFLVEDRGRKFVVRFGQDFPFHHVFRDREVMAAKAAHAAGLAPEIVHAEPGVMVSAFIEGRTYTAEAVRAAAPRIAALVRRFHMEMPRHVSGPAPMFWVFHVIRDYARTLRRGGSRMTSMLDGFLELAEELERAQAPLPIVFGHNDLLPANFIDDGKRLWLIDFEYAGFTTAMFDLAGLASNAGFSETEADALLAEYFGAPPSPALRRSHAAMQCASLLREAMWSMVSELHLDAPGADYPAYTQTNLAALDVALERYRSAYDKERS